MDKEKAGLRVTSRVKCPYCGAESWVGVTFRYLYEIRSAVHHCDLELGGCDRDFVVRCRLTPQTEVLRIEGEGDDMGGKIMESTRAKAEGQRADEGSIPSPSIDLEVDAEWYADYRDEVEGARRP